jgi:uncharacterized membrane protein
MASSHPLDRFNAFSDGVFAIAITLMALELPIPEEGMALMPYLLGHWYDFLGYLISFAFIGGIWFTHSALTRDMEGSDATADGINLLLLLFVALLPFSTKLLVTNLTGEWVGVAVFIYGLNVLATSLTRARLIFYVAKTDGLVTGGVDPDRLHKTAKHHAMLTLVNLIALVTSLIAPYIAVGFYIVMAMTMLIAPPLGIGEKRKDKPALSEEGME